MNVPTVDPCCVQISLLQRVLVAQQILIDITMLLRSDLDINMSKLGSVWREDCQGVRIAVKARVSNNVLKYRFGGVNKERKC